EPWCTDPDPRRAWALSEVQVRAARLREVLLPEGCAQELVDAVRRSWGRFEAPDLFGGRPREDLALFALVRDDLPGWRGRARSGADKELELRYDAARGLVFLD
ncbi:MAG: hypothetical protein RMJ04_15310, partial [Geminicoccaceae bacterium]|nr:hypothetical protein [Geminicoccaceae bacterium]